MRAFLLKKSILGVTCSLKKLNTSNYTTTRVIKKNVESLFFSLYNTTSKQEINILIRKFFKKIIPYI